ncbi:MAG: maleylacetoacetate isomerase [Proteobacteria bacterium]|nr:MAG: maleylacetoacetate isomerase [Pseudomonadota bacterium]
MSAPYALYAYFRSSASYRVRIALAYKGLAYAYRPVHLLEGGGQQLSEAYRAVNPLAELPALVIEGAGQGGADAILAQSVAILEYLEEVHPQPPLLPATGPLERARVRQLVESVNSSIQPVQNLKVMKKLGADYGADRPAMFRWARYWVERGFEGLEALLTRTAGRYAFGDAVTLADVALVPQVYNARRFDCDMARFPTIARVSAAAEAIDAFVAAHPHRQPDTPPELREG